jgi:hypothetical protein
MAESDDPTGLEWMRWRVKRGARRFRRRHDLAFLAGLFGLALVVILALWLY